jgi:hypothetical protein
MVGYYLAKDSLHFHSGQRAELLAIFGCQQFLRFLPQAEHLFVPLENVLKKAINEFKSIRR